MQKRIILVLATLLCVLAGLFIYQKATVPQPSAKPAGQVVPLPPIPTKDGSAEDIEQIKIGKGEVGIIQSENPHFEYRNQEGRITQEFWFEKRIGTNQISHPGVKIFSKDNRVILITAETGSVTLENDSGQPQSGYLEQVLIQMYHVPEPEPSSEQPKSSEQIRDIPIEATVQLEGRVDFEVEFSRMESRDKFTVTSESFNAHGRGLSLVYDQVNERLQELELRQIDKLIIPAESIGSSGSKKSTQAEMAQAKVEKPSAGIAPAKKPDKTTETKITTYRLTLSDEIVIDQGSEKLTADDIEIIALVDYAQFKQQDSLFGSASQPQPSAEKTEPTPGTASSAKKQTVKNSPENNIVITCKGPLHITIDEEETLSSSGEQLRFRATGKPAQIWREGELAVETDEIRYEKSRSQIRLSSLSARPVRLLLASNQWATARREVIIDQNQALTTLRGPGRIEYSDPDSKQRSYVEYQNQVQAKFATKTKPDDLSAIDWKQIENLTFTGQLSAKTENGSVRAEQGRLNFYPPVKKLKKMAKDSPKTKDSKKAEKNEPPRLKSLELAGNVRAEGKDSNFAADQINATFAPAEAETGPLQFLNAKGNVRVEDPNYIIEASEYLRLTFDVKTAVPAMVSSDKQNTYKEAKNLKQGKGNLGFDQLLKQSNLKSAQAEGADGGVRFTIKDDKYQIVGDRVEGDAVQDIWTIYGNKAQVIGLAGQGRLEGKTITANLSEGLCSIPGAGSLETTVKSGLLETSASKDRSKTTSTTPAQMYINWQDGSAYSMKGHNITLQNVRVRIEQTEKTRRVTELNCLTMTVLLDQNSDKTKTERSGRDALSNNKLKELQTQGPSLVITAREYELETDQIISNAEIHAKNMRYEDSSGSLVAQGPGWIELINYQQDQPQDNTRKKPAPVKTIKPASNLFGSDSSTRSLIQFGKQLDFKRDQNRLIFSGGVALDHRPLKAKTTGREPASSGQFTGMRSLDCNYLELIFARNRKDSGGKTGVGTPELTAIDRVEARGQIFAETISPEGREHFFAGHSLVYDIKTDTLDIHGNSSTPAYFDMEPFSSVRWNLGTGRIIAVPAGVGSVAKTR